jgi:predicted nucleic acid-binding protein
VRSTVIDTSSLRAIAHLNLTTELSLFFDVVYVPRQVHIELNRKHKFRHRLNKLYDTRIYRRCLVADRTNVLLLMPQLEEGEAEGITQAQEKALDRIILDEKKARAVAANMRIQPIGVARLLFRLERDGQIESAALLIARLKKELRFRISAELVEEARAKAEEPI